MKWGEALAQPSPPTAREERRRKVERELLPKLNAWERQVFAGYWIDWISRGDYTFEQLKRNIRHAQECHAADMRAGRIGPQFAQTAQAPLDAQALAVLGLSAIPTPTLAEIKSAYRRLAREFHPDFGGTDEKRMVMINRAYQILIQRGKQWKKQ